MLPSPDKSSTKNSFCFYHDPRSRVKSQSNAYFFQRIGAGIFKKNGNSSAGAHFFRPVVLLKRIAPTLELRRRASGQQIKGLNWFHSKGFYLKRAASISV
tara:strand:- start:30 stop:329 length:300 start_codon:yes stop_codon:yes gene_type:complete